MDKFAHGTGVPCRAKETFDHSFRSQSKGNLLSRGLTKKGRFAPIKHKRNTCQVAGEKLVDP